MHTDKLFKELMVTLLYLHEYIILDCGNMVTYFAVFFSKKKSGNSRMVSYNANKQKVMSYTKQLFVN